MATKREAPVAPAAPDDNELVEVFVPFTNQNEPDKFVSVNGVNWLIPRGRSHKVPRYVANELKRGVLAEQRQHMNQQELLRRAQNAQG